MLLVLTVIAGGLDAVAFIALGGTFVGNQTGTVLLLVMGITDTAPVETAASAASLVSFVVGAALAACRRRRQASRGRDTPGPCC